MKYLKNLRGQTVADTDNPADLAAQLSPQVPAAARVTKAAFRAWCGQEDTDHAFISANEGVAANLRISTENPIRISSGLICDYDSAVDWADLETRLAQVCPYVPTFVHRSFSGALRIGWMFEEPIPVDPTVYPLLARELSHILAAEKATYGLDPGSLRAEQYFEIGSDWRLMGGFVPQDVVKGLVCKASLKAGPLASDTAIPISEVAAEVERQFPGRWKKSFEVGARGPLFWIDDGVEREACVVREDGVTCFSDRAGKGFLSWREVLGARFVKDYETKKLAPLLDEYWFDGRSFLKLSPITGTPVSVTERQVERELRQRGFSPKARKSNPLSETEAALLTVQNQNRVDCVAPLLYSKSRVVTYNSQRILNSSQNSPTHPADNGDPALWPFLHAWLDQLFVDPEDNHARSLDYLYSWLSRGYLATLGRYPAQGQALLLVGPTGRGKTLLSNKVVGGAFGGFEDASEYLGGKTSFNKNLCGAGLWVVDDTVSAASFQDQRRATELLKRTVANPKVEYHAKYVDSITLPWSGRVILTLNMDSNSLSVVPSLDSSNRDKIMALRLADTATASFPDNHVLESVIEKELPYFCRFLADWKVPPAVQGDSRFGVKPYVDPFIVAAAFDNGPRAAIAELVDWFAKTVRHDLGGLPFWQGTLTEWQTTLLRYNDGRHIGHSHNLEFVRRGFGAMEEAFKQDPGIHRPVMSYGEGGGKVWALSLDPSFDLRVPSMMGGGAADSTDATDTEPTPESEARASSDGGAPAPSSADSAVG